MSDLRIIEGGRQPDQPEGSPRTWKDRFIRRAKDFFNRNPLVQALRGDLVFKIRPSNAELEGLKAGRLESTGASIGSMMEFLDKQADQKTGWWLEPKRPPDADPSSNTSVTEKPIPGSNLRRITINKPEE